MTERLKELLDGEVGDLSVPSPATDAVLRRGRGLRRRNRLAAAGGGLAALVVLGGSVVALTGDGGERAAPDPTAPTVGDNAVFSYGNLVFYDGPAHQAEVQDPAVKSLYYTSAGVLVRHGDNPWSDGGGPQRFSLVQPDGTVQVLGLVTEETVHATDVDQPYVAYGEAVDGDLQVVVYDVTADAEEARVTVGPTEENWFPVSVDDDTVYVQDGYDGDISAVDWQAGTTGPTDVPTAWDVVDGRVATKVDGQPAIVDADTGDVLLTVDGPGYFELSPDGRYAELVQQDEGSSPGSEVSTEVYEVGSGTSVTVTGPAYDWGWTADGDLFRVGKSDVLTCSAATGECAAEPYAQPELPQPPPVTETFRNPVCPPGDGDCYLDNEFLQHCSDNPDQCEWTEDEYVQRQTNELKLGGRTYES